MNNIPSDLETLTLARQIQNINLNRDMPKDNNGRSKLIINCTDEEIEQAITKIHTDIFNRCDDMYGDIPNLARNILLKIWYSNKDIKALELLSLAMSAINKLYSKNNNNIDNNTLEYKQQIIKLLDDMQESIIIEKAHDKKYYTEQLKKKDIAFSQQRYYDGQQDMLNKILNAIGE